MNKRVILPDFGRFFRTNNRRPIDFTCRDGANLLHDFVFLRNYLHDASFEMKSVKRSGKVLRIRLQRDRWELQKRSERLENISSELIITPVVSMKWQSQSRIGSKDRFFVRDVYLGESIWDATDRAEVVLSGFGRKPTQLRIVVQDPFEVRLRDIAVDLS